MADGSLKIDTGFNLDGIENDLSELNQIVGDSGSELSDRMTHNVAKMTEDFERFSTQLHASNMDVMSLTSSVEDLKAGIAYNKSIGDIEGAQALTLELSKAEKELGKATNQSSRLTQGLSMTGVRASEMLGRLGPIPSKLKESDAKAKDLSKSMKSVSNSSKGMGDGIGSGIKKLAKYSAALFSIRTIYSTLTKHARMWLDSDSIAAQQTKANINGISSAVTNSLGPVIQMLTGWVMTLVGYINVLTKSFFNLDLFAKSTKKSTGGMAGDIKKAKKETDKFLTGFDEIEKITSSTSDNLDGMGGGGGGLDFEIQTPDTSKFEKLIGSLVKTVMKDFEPFIDMMKGLNFDPLIESGKKLGSSLGGVLSVLYQSAVRLTNEAFGPFIKMMVEDIAPTALNTIASVIETMTPGLEWLLINVVEPLFKWFLLEFVPTSINLLIAALEFLEPIMVAVGKAFQEVYDDTWEPMFTWIGDTVIGIIDGLSEAFGIATDELNENDESLVRVLAALMKVGTYILIAIAIFKTLSTIVGIASVAWGFITSVIGIATTAFGAVKAIIVIVTSATAGLVAGVVALVVAVVAMAIGIVENWEMVWQNIKDIVGNIKGIFSGLINFITGVFTGDWSRAWSGIIEIFSNIFGGIVNIAKLPINMLIDGINVLIKGLNKIKIPNWVPGVGGKGLNFSPITRLAQGGIITRPTQVLAGEGGREAYIPIDNNTSALDELADKLFERIGGGGGQTDLYLDSEKVATATKKSNERKRLQLNGGFA